MAIQPSTAGFGFAFFTAPGFPLDWGVKVARRGSLNRGCLKHFERLIEHYAPHTLVLPDFEGENSRRVARVRQLLTEMAKIAEKKGITVRRYSRDQIRKVFRRHGAVTKYEIANVICDRYVEFELRRPAPARKIWLNEHFSLPMFDAVALVITHYVSTGRHMEEWRYMDDDDLDT
jgi:Holliday junction resolvasome RuvABC endonuclease subunit